MGWDQSQQHQEELSQGPIADPCSLELSQFVYARNMPASLLVSCDPTPMVM